MASRSRRRALSVAGRLLVPILGLIFLIPVSADAQYFGRNKVQYDDFDFRTLSTSHFDIHFYGDSDEVIEDLARMSERWYERFARLFQHEFDEPKPLIFYADHPDFQQTNTIGAALSEGVGGVTEALKKRVIMPISSSYGSTDHVRGHEIVHAFQYNIAQSRRGGGIQGLSGLPLWMVEGMAEYLSLGQEDPLTAMWLRDALLRDDFPTLQQMTRETRFFPYRFGQAFWTHVGREYGDETVISLFRASLRMGWQPAIQQTLRISPDSLSARWRESTEEHFAPLMEGKTAPGEAGTLLLSPATGAGRQNVAPSVSPDGTRMVFMSEKDLFSFDLWLADARTGEVIRRLSSQTSDSHFDALRFIDSSGAWAPDGSRIAFVVFAGGRNEILVVDTEGGDMVDRIRVNPSIGEITGPTFTPDGATIIFSGQAHGATDLYQIDLDTHAVQTLTRDRHAALQPAVSPDGRLVAFVSDRGPETDFDRLEFSEMQISLFDTETRRVETLDLFGNVRHSNPQFTPDGRDLYFLSDADGFSDIYRLNLESGEVLRVTEVATGVSGISAMSPAMSVAAETGTVVFSVFDEFEFHVYSVDSRDMPSQPVLVAEFSPAGRLLPPTEVPRTSRIQAYLDDPESGLPVEGLYSRDQASGYDRSLSLDYITQPTATIGQDRFGTLAAGSVAAFFSDMLGNRNLGVAVQAQGSLKDLGGQVVYQNLERRWNWGAGGGRIPILFFQQGIGRNQTGNTILQQDLLRIYQSQAFGLLSYAQSRTRRLEFSAGVNRYSFDLERTTVEYNQFGQPVRYEQGTRNDLMPASSTLAEASVAYVGDNSYFGFASPVRGHRFRFEVGQTIGSADFGTVIMDYRRYMSPTRNATLALRGLHVGRYGEELDRTIGTDEAPAIIQPQYLGWGSLVRGYSDQSFERRECIAPADGQGIGGCPVYDRLFGNRVAVLNAEIRVPLLGTDQYGLLDFGFTPTELALFADAGLAWDSQREPTMELTRSSTDRIPVISTGASARINVLGYLIAEVYYAFPWQRPDKGWHWGFQLTPGW